TRQSSEGLAMDDPLVAQAVRYIREHASEGINVEDVLEAVHISRSALERRMITRTGRSPKSEILHVRINRVKQLLYETNLPLSQISKMTGFIHPQYMSHVFKKMMGQTPGEYRRSLKA